MAECHNCLCQHLPNWVFPRGEWTSALRISHPAWPLRMIGVESTKHRRRPRLGKLFCSKEETVYKCKRPSHFPCKLCKATCCNICARDKNSEVVNRMGIAAGAPYCEQRKQSPTLFIWFKSHRSIHGTIKSFCFFKNKKAAPNSIITTTQGA